MGSFLDASCAVSSPRWRQTLQGWGVGFGMSLLLGGVPPVMGRASEIQSEAQKEMAPAHPLIPPPALVAPNLSAGEGRSESVSPPPQSGTPEETRRRFADLQIPIYQRVRPEWGTEIAYSLKGLGSTTQLPSVPGISRLSAVSLRVEYQPAFMQAIGVLGLGASFQYFSLPSEIAASGLSCYSVGGQARYQLKLLREQWIVPYAGYAADRLAYRLKDGTQSSFLSKGPFFGASLLLNIFEPSVAADAYAGTGIIRTYLFGELRSLSGGDAQLPVSGRSAFFGLRFEY